MLSCKICPGQSLTSKTFAILNKICLERNCNCKRSTSPCVKKTLKRPSGLFFMLLNSNINNPNYANTNPLCFSLCFSGCYLVVSAVIYALSGSKLIYLNFGQHDDTREKLYMRLIMNVTRISVYVVTSLLSVVWHCRLLVKRCKCK